MSNNCMQGEKRICVDCYNDFFISDREIEYYRKKKLFIPKRCAECREIRRRNRGPVNKYEGLNDILPTLYKGKTITGGIDVTDISGYKWGVSSYY